jgi:hypothetical protein
VGINPVTGLINITLDEELISVDAIQRYLAANGYPTEEPITVAKES